MDIKSINSNNHMTFTRQTYTKNTANTEKHTPAVNEEAVSVRISNEALNRNNHGEASKLTPQRDTSFFKAPEKGTIQQAAKPEIPVKEIFQEGTAEHFIFNALDGKTENAYELAKQLGGMIFSKDSGADVETRAIDRETGKKLAEYIAQNYLGDPDETGAFLDGINKFAEKSEMRDKGYTVIIGSDVEPFKPKFNDLQQFAKDKFEFIDVEWGDTEKASKIVRAFTLEAMNLAGADSKNNKYSEKSLPSLLDNDSAPHMYKEEKEALRKAFDDNEIKVQGMIDAIKNTVGGVAVDNDFFANMNSVPNLLNPSQSAKLSDIFKLLNN